MDQPSLEWAQLQARLKGLLTELWAQQLHDPAVWSALTERKNSLRIMSPWDAALQVILFAWAVFLGLYVHGLITLAAVLLALILIARKSGRVIREREWLEYLTAPPRLVLRGDCNDQDHV
ncbi:hypothetical protein [Marinobacter sp. F4216]|uniref:hypothetical protein n=1 Tax=Marinobacter sp. F4216 TaxID=2874281 RepID=UPI001CC05963|nr:hypothetical protein [Marinobacter sp. F4216]MBZ2170269.1 hypothetical protein [Marinobacter sp. F4216]